MLLTEAMEKMDLARAWAAQNQELSKDEMKAIFDLTAEAQSRADAKELEVGEKVLVYWPQTLADSEGRTVIVHHLEEKMDSFMVHIDRVLRVIEVPEKEWKVHEGQSLLEEIHEGAHKNFRKGVGSISGTAGGSGGKCGRPDGPECV